MHCEFQNVFHKVVFLQLRITVKIKTEKPVADTSVNKYIHWHTEKFPP